MADVQSGYDDTELRNRMTQAESDIDSLESSVSEKATTASVTALSDRVSHAESDIDNIENLIPSNASDTNKLATMTDVQSVYDALKSNFQTGLVTMDENNGTSPSASKSVTFTTPFTDNNYILNIIPAGGYGYANVQWQISNKSVSGFNVGIYRIDGQNIGIDFAPRYTWQAYKLPGE